MDVPVAFPIPQRNGTSEDMPVGPDMTTDVHDKSLVLAVLCSCSSLAIVCLFFYCCCRARYSDSFYECSCTYERPASQSSQQVPTTRRPRKATVISGSISIKIPSKDSHKYQPSTDTIIEQPESDDGSSNVYNATVLPTKNTCAV